MTAAAPHPITEWSKVSREVFETEILPAQRPAVLRGLVEDWPLVRDSQGMAAALHERLGQHAAEGSVKVMVAPSATRGWMHYNDDLSGFNFERREIRFRDLLAYLLAHAARPGAAVAMQSVLAEDIVPGFENDHRLDLVDATVKPRLWIGNAVTVAAHYDPSENIACVLAGRRRFTLFPPEQVANLYIGPLESTPAGASISLVTNPDDVRFPRFAAALAAAQSAELGPGDAIYIPYLWWHQVESLEPLNLLANYWWSPVPTERGDPREAFIHALVAMRTLAPPQRRAWRALFDHYVFEVGEDPAAHIPPACRGVLGDLPIETILAVRRELSRLMDPDG